MVFIVIYIILLVVAWYAFYEVFDKYFPETSEVMKSTIAVICAIFWPILLITHFLRKL